MIPKRLPLNTTTLTFILRSCHNSAVRRTVIRHEIDIIRANRIWGMLTKHQAAGHLDRITWAFYNYWRKL